MRSRLLCACVLFILGLRPAFALPTTNVPSNYPHFHNNPFLDQKIKLQIAPFLLPLEHPMQATLDAIFSHSRVLENEQALLDAGFVIIAGPMPYSYVIVARHPAVPGYVFKLYLDSETRYRKNIPHWVWLARRCAGAQGIRKVINQKKIQHFAIPDKWLYVLPPYPPSTSLNPQPVILMETDMEPESKEVSVHMWKTTVTRKHLDELYSILKHGYGGHGVINLPNNVPFTKQGKFAFTDTEDPRNDLNLKHIKKYLSKGMQHYWDNLIN